MFSQYGERRPTNGWDWLVSFGYPSKFHGFRVLASLIHRRRLTEVNHTLHDVWPSPVLVHYIYILGAVVPNGILPGAKFSASKSCVILCWQRYCTALEQWASAKLCGIVSSRDRAAIPFDIGRSNCLVFGNNWHICWQNCGINVHFQPSVNQLDSMRWFSHRCSPSPPGGHATVLSVATCCVRPTAHALLCIVNGDDSAVFRFFCPRWPWPLTFDPKFELGRDFCTVHLTAKFNRPVIVVRELSCGPSDKSTDKQTDAAENIHLASLRYAAKSLLCQFT